MSGCRKGREVKCWSSYAGVQFQISCMHQLLHKGSYAKQMVPECRLSGSSNEIPGCWIIWQKGNDVFRKMYCRERSVSCCLDSANKFCTVWKKNSGRLADQIYADHISSAIHGYVVLWSVVLLTCKWITSLFCHLQEFPAEMVWCCVSSTWASDSACIIYTTHRDTDSSCSYP